jgi:5-methylcytosine-specific restriction endonuclease McrA
MDSEPALALRVVPDDELLRRLSDLVSRSRRVEAELGPAARADQPAPAGHRERDGSRCRFVDEHGHRCSERSTLEFHHVYPFAMGGDHNLDNIQLLCPQHNRLLAEHDYGRAAIRRRIKGAPESPAKARQRPLLDL